MKKLKQSVKEWHNVMNTCLDLIDKKVESLEDENGLIEKKETVALVSCFAALTHSVIASVAFVNGMSEGRVTELFFEAVRTYQGEEKGGES